MDILWIDHRRYLKVAFHRNRLRARKGRNPNLAFAGNDDLVQHVSNWYRIVSCIYSELWFDSAAWKTFDFPERRPHNFIRCIEQERIGTSHRGGIFRETTDRYIQWISTIGQQRPWEDVDDAVLQGAMRSPGGRKPRRQERQRRSSLLVTVALVAGCLPF